MVRKAKKHKHYAWFVQMRLGKTLAFIRRFWRKKNILMIAPKTALIPWEQELKTEGKKYKVLLGPMDDRRRRLVGKGYRLINPEGVKALANELDAIPWDVVGVDESVFLKEPRSQITKTMLKLFRDVPRRMIMTGLQNPEGPENYVCPMIWLVGEFMGCTNFWQFRIRFMRPAGFGWVLKKGVWQKMKKEIRKNAMFLTRKDVKMDVKEVVETRYVEMSPPQRKAYKELKKSFAFSLDPGHKEETKWAPVRYLGLSRLASGIYKGRIINEAKLKELVKLLRTELRKDQVVIWVKHTDQGKAVLRALRRAEIKSERIYGGTRHSDRKRRIRRFRRGALRALVLQFKVGKYALDLSCASTNIYFTLPESLDDYEQTKNRVVDLSRKLVLNLHICTRGTVDEERSEALCDKKITANLINHDKTYVGRGSK